MQCESFKYLCEKCDNYIHNLPNKKIHSRITNLPEKDSTINSTNIINNINNNKSNEEILNYINQQNDTSNNSQKISNSRNNQRNNNINSGDRDLLINSNLNEFNILS
jgi:hypothetical protein